MIVRHARAADGHDFEFQQLFQRRRVHELEHALGERQCVSRGAGDLTRQRDYWLGTTLFKMRRRYGDAGALLLGVYKDMGGSAAEAMFHGARALSRADKDDEAIVWFQKAMQARRYESPAFPHLNIGRVYEKKGRWTEAIEAYKKALTLNPNYALAKKSLGRLISSLN